MWVWLPVAAAVFMAAGCAGGVPALPATDTSPQREALQRVLAVYPSAKLFPVANPYLFYWDYGPPPDFSGAVFDAQGANTPANVADARKLNRLPVHWTFGPQWPGGHSRQDFIDYYLQSLKSSEAVQIAEWQSPDPHAEPGSPLYAKDPYGIEGAIAGLAAAKKADPTSLVIVAWRGENSLLPLIRAGGVDYIAIEAYTNVAKDIPLNWGISVLGVDLRIAKARRWGVLDRTIPWLGHIVPFDQYHRGHELTVADLANQIRHYRAIAPQMPGLAFYGGAPNLVLAKAASDLARKYFIDPAPEVAIETPAAGAVISQAPHTITIRAMPKGGRKIIEYKGYIDNELVYVGKHPSFTWDFSYDAPGAHFITVHAIDSGWNRAAAQIRVECE